MPNALRHITFPSPLLADADGLVAVGGEYEPSFLVSAYRQGIFPWPMSDGEMPIEDMPALWFSPDPRAILDFKNLHLSDSLRRFQKKCRWRFSRNEAFAQVLDECALQPRPGQTGTWIIPALKSGMLALFHQGNAWSVEVWEGANLVGGIYGVLFPGFCSGESMFHKKSNASKLALIYAVESLKKEGHDWMDIQVMTTHLKALGAEEISRADFLKKIPHS
jgi:leucyl/phenylalanyl-tRNA--protein transferase